MKLELKHLAGYLPYQLKINATGYTGILTTQILDYYFISEIKPILRPLSNIIKQIEVNGEKFIPLNKLQLDYDYADELSIYDFSTKSRLNMEDIYFVVDSLLEWHFDIYGLIENGLAISIHDVEEAGI